MMNLSARILTVSLASLLAVALAVGSASSAFAASSSTATYQKSEVVYASLSAAGAPEAVYVVNRFDVEKPGTVVDHGDYTKVQNLTNETELARQGTPPRSRSRRARCTTRATPHPPRCRGTSRSPTSWTARR